MPFIICWKCVGNCGNVNKVAVVERREEGHERSIDHKTTSHLYSYLYFWLTEERHLLFASVRTEPVDTNGPSRSSTKRLRFTRHCHCLGLHFRISTIPFFNNLNSILQFTFYNDYNSILKFAFCNDYNSILHFHFPFCNFKWLHFTIYILRQLWQIFFCIPFSGLTEVRCGLEVNMLDCESKGSGFKSHPG